MTVRDAGTVTQEALDHFAALSNSEAIGAAAMQLGYVKALIDLANNDARELTPSEKSALYQACGIVAEVAFVLVHRLQPATEEDDDDA